jgi:hypothetical protein
MHRLYKPSERIVPDAGIAIGVVLFVVALLGVIAMAMTAGSNTVGSTIISDRVRSDLKSQANLIRSKILECNQYSFERGELADKYPASTGSGTLVEALDCLAFVAEGTALPNNLTSLWSGAHAATLPPPTAGFDKWVYVNAGASGGRCIRIQPLPANTGDVGIKTGLAQAFSAFSSQEIVYDPNSASQRFILWITAPSGTVSANCSS